MPPPGTLSQSSSQNFELLFAHDAYLNKEVIGVDMDAPELVDALSTGQTLHMTAGKKMPKHMWLNVTFLMFCSVSDGIVRVSKITTRGIMYLYIWGRVIDFSNLIDFTPNVFE